MAGLFGGYRTRDEQIQAELQERKGRLPAGYASAEDDDMEGKMVKKEKKRKPIYLMSDKEYLEYLRSKR